ncbi:MAG: rhodanese-like domain-containing protein [Rhodospirillales bacterium]
MADATLEIGPKDLVMMRERGAKHLVVDVREKWELDVAALPDVKHIPLGELQTRFAELPKDRPLVMFCRSGRRSMDAALFLRQRGYAQAVNLRGGVLAWAAEVDPSMKTY